MNEEKIEKNELFDFINQVTFGIELEVCWHNLAFPTATNRELIKCFSDKSEEYTDSLKLHWSPILDVNRVYDRWYVTTDSTVSCLIGNKNEQFIGQEVKETNNLQFNNAEIISPILDFRTDVYKCGSGFRVIKMIGMVGY